MTKRSRKLHIGAGRVQLPGFINLDLFDNFQQDMYADLTRLPWEEGSFDLIYACHVLEHCHRKMISVTLHHWYSMLRKGGVLRLAVPSFDAIAERYRETRDVEELMGLLYGRQDYPRNNHFITFNHDSLSAYLKRAGFRKVRSWDWRKTEHASFDDFSQCRLPHMSDGPDTIWCSLNLEAVK
jgi:predicted SAM-dependent methyltransferase